MMRRTLRAVVCVGAIVFSGRTAHPAALPPVQNVYVRFKAALALRDAFPDAVSDFRRDLPALLGRARFFSWSAPEPSSVGQRPQLTIELTFDDHGAVVLLSDLVTADGKFIQIAKGQVLDGVQYLLLSAGKRKWSNQKEKNDAFAKPLRAQAADYLLKTLHPTVGDLIPIATTVTALSEKKKVIVPVPYMAVASKIMKGEVQRGTGLDLNRLKPLRLEVIGKADDGGAITIIQVAGRALTPEEWKVFDTKEPAADRIHIDFKATDWRELLTTPEAPQ
jgi:hypothetical protein